MNCSSSNTTEVTGFIDKMGRWQISKVCLHTPTCTSMHQLSHCKLLKHTLHDPWTCLWLHLPLCTCGHQERGSVRGWVEGTLRTPRTHVEPTTDTHTHVHTCTVHMYTHMYIHVHTHTHTHAHSHTHKHTHTHACRHNTHITTYDIVTY